MCTRYPLSRQAPCAWLPSPQRGEGTIKSGVLASPLPRGQTVAAGLVRGWRKPFGSFVALLMLVANACGAEAQTTHQRAPPDLLQRVGFDQNLGRQVPLDARFREAN